MWARHEAQIYMVVGSNATHVTLMHPKATGPGVVNVALNGPPLLVPGILTIERRKADFFRDEPIAPMLPIPIESGLQPGARCRWGTSLAEWTVLSIKSDIASVRQCSGWNQAMVFNAPVQELMLLRPEAKERRAA